MTNSNTTPTGAATERALYDAYLDGLRHGIARGMVMALGTGELKAHQFALRTSEMAACAARLAESRSRFWPHLMPGGWPIPPDILSDDETTWWPEDNGWPCPPPELRGGA